MSCLHKCHMVNRGNKHGPHKYTEGFSDTSSIGSLMDETDREVSSLTDRAFKSLCIDEEGIYNDSEATFSSSENKQAFTVDTQSSTVDGVLFSHSLVDHIKQEHIHWNDHVHHLNNGAIESDWLQNRGKSKGLSIVKTFTTAKNDIKGDFIVDHLSRNVTKCKQSDVNCDSWDKSALLSIQRELSEFSSVAYPQNFKMGNSSSSKSRSIASKIQTTNMDLSLPSLKSSKGKSRKSTKHKKLNSKNFFLHSEFSPFQAWRECHRFEHDSISNLLSANDLPKWYDSPLYKELTEATRLTQTEESKQHSKAIAFPAPNFPKKEHKDLATEKTCISPQEQQKIIELEKHIHSSKELNKTLKFDKSCPSPKDLQKAVELVKQDVAFNDLQKVVAVEKISDSEAGASCPPWRRNRSLLKKTQIIAHPCTMPPSKEQSGTNENESTTTGQDPTENEATSETNTLFSISQLLTPIIHVGQKVETPGKSNEMFSSTEHFLPAIPEFKVRPTPEVKLYDSYKVMASSLLFNIKDNRKRVKNMYSPPKFKALNPKDPSRLLQMQDTSGPKSVHAISETSVAVVSAAAHPNAGDAKSVCSNTLEPTDERTDDHKKLADTCISDDYLTLSSPRTVEEGISHRSCPGVMQEDVGQAELAEIWKARSPLVSNNQSRLKVEAEAPELPYANNRSGKDYKNASPNASALQKFAVLKDEKMHVGNEGPFMSGMNFVNRSEVSAEEMKEAKQGLDVNKHGMIIDRAVTDKDSIITVGDKESIPSEPKDFCLLTFAEQRKDNGLRTNEEQQTKSKILTNQERDSVKKALNSGSDARKEVGAEHAFSQRQNQYIKNERYAMKGDEDEHVSTAALKADKNIKNAASDQEYQRAERGVVLGRLNKEDGCNELENLHVEQEMEGDVQKEKRPVRSDAALANEHDVGKHGPLTNGCIFDGSLNSKEVTQAKTHKCSAQKAERVLGTESEIFAAKGYEKERKSLWNNGNKKCTENELSRIRDADLTEQAVVERCKGKRGGSDNKKIGLINQNLLASKRRGHGNSLNIEAKTKFVDKVKDKGDVSSIKGIYLIGEDKSVVKSKGHEKPSKHVDKVMMAKGNVMQKVLSYMNENIRDKQKLTSDVKELLKNTMSTAGVADTFRQVKIQTKQKETQDLGKIPQAKEASQAVRQREQGESDLVAVKEKVCTPLKETASKENIAKKLVVQEKYGVIVKNHAEKVHPSKQDSAAEEHAAADAPMKEGFKKIHDEQVEKNIHTGQNRPSGVTSPAQMNSMIDEQTAQVMESSISTKECHQSDKAQVSVQNLPFKGPNNVLVIERKDLEKMELQYCCDVNQEKEGDDKDRLVTSPQTDWSASWTDGSDRSPSEMDEGGWVRCLIDCVKTQSYFSQSSTPLSPVGKLTLFKVKDNTFRNSPITKTVKLPFHHLFPEQFSLDSSKESLSGSERGEDEPYHTKVGTGASFPHGASPAAHINGTLTQITPRARRWGHVQWNPIPEEEESRSFTSGMSEDLGSCALSRAGTEETAASAALTEDITLCKEPSERSVSVCSTNDSQLQNKPPAVPPKTEKALRRAQKLTSRRTRKEEAKNKAQESRRDDPKPIFEVQGTVPHLADCLVLPKLASVSEAVPALSSPQPQYFPPPAVDDEMPSFALTQRKLLQDPDSGQYFVVDMPMQIKTKTFFDPETGTYIQLPVQLSKEDSSPQISPSAFTATEAGAAPYMLCQGFVPIPVSSLSPHGSSSRILSPLAFTDTPEKLEGAAYLRQDSSEGVDCKDVKSDIEPNVTNVLESKQSYCEDKDSISTENMDAVSLGQPDDCAIEGS